MFDWLKSRLTIRNARQLVSIATTAIYSRQTDLVPLLDELTRKLPPFDQLRMFVAIQYATLPHLLWEDEESSSDSHFLLGMFNQAEQEFLADSGESALAIESNKAKTHLIQAEIEFFIRKGSFETDPDSYDGMRYRMEKQLKRPVSRHENVKLREIARQLAAANAVIDRGVEKE
jgi:hypothetical protein